MLIFIFSKTIYHCYFYYPNDIYCKKKKKEYVGFISISLCLLSKQCFDCITNIDMQLRRKLNIYLINVISR